MGSILTASNLCFMDFIHYPEIHIEENCTTFLCGESGCGKSTLLKLFNTTLSPSSGTIYFHKSKIDTCHTIEYRRKVLLVSQEVYLFNGTIQENFEIYHASRDTNPINEESIKKYLTICQGIFPLDTHCSVLSGGERQRVFLAICLSFYPEVLLLDEPTSSLDGKTAKNVLTNIKEYCKSKKITMVVVCHDQTLIDLFADKIISLSKGERT